VCGVLFLCAPASIAAIVLGHLAVADIKHSANRITGHGMAVAGLVMAGRFANHWSRSSGHARIASRSGQGTELLSTIRRNSLETMPELPWKSCRLRAGLSLLRGSGRRTARWSGAASLERSAGE
jgi:hypothetical protein